MRQFQVRDGVCRIAFDKQCVAEQLVRGNQILFQLDSLLQWRDCIAVLVFLHVCLSEADETFGQVGIQFRRLPKLDNGDVKLMLFIGGDTCPEMIERLR